MPRMSTIHRKTCAQMTTPLCNRCHDDVMRKQPPLPQQTFFQLLHTMHPRTVDPLSKDTLDAVARQLQIRRI